MKTKHFLVISGLAILSVAASNAQENKSKTCIKIIKLIDGVETRVDTCFEGDDPATLENFMKNMGESGEVHINNSGKNGIKTKVMIMDDKDGKNSHSKKTIVKKSRAESNAKQGDSVIVKEIETQVSVGDDGAVIIITNGDTTHIHEVTNDSLFQWIHADENNTNEGDDKRVEVKVIIRKNINVSDVESNERSSLPKKLQCESKEKLTDLKVIPSQGELEIGFSSKSKEPVTITIYDTNGNLLLAEKEQVTESDFNKRLDVLSLKPGIYFIQIVQGTKSEVKKVVITENK